MLPPPPPPTPSPPILQALAVLQAASASALHCESIDQVLHEGHEMLLLLK